MNNIKKVKEENLKHNVVGMLVGKYLEWGKCSC